MFEVIINRCGRIETEIVDDLIPFYAEDQTSLWGLTLDEPWKLILGKVWAKIKGSYHQVSRARPFEFLENFTLFNWKYYNLSIDGKQFLTYNHHRLFSEVKIILKTKQSQEVEKAGLLPGKYCYHINRFTTYENEGKKEGTYLAITIDSLYPHFWTGQLSIFDQHFP